jgi:hypothetical protein
LVVAFVGETLSEEVLGKDAGLGEAVDAFANFEVYPAVVYVMQEVVLSDEFLWDVREFDFDVLGSVEGGAEIEVGDVEGAEARTFVGEDTVDHEFDQFKWCRFGADIAWVADAVTCDGDACSIGVGFFGTYFADDVAVADFFETVGRNVGKVDDVKGVGVVDWWHGRVGAFETLAETA